MRDKIEVKTRDLDDSLLPTLGTKPQFQLPYSAGTSRLRYTFGVLHIFLAFGLGALACLVAQASFSHCFTKTGKPQSSQAVIGDTKEDVISVLAPPYVGSTSVHQYPPATPTNAYPSLFPSDVGYPGGTPTGAEPGVIATAPAYPMYTGQCFHQLLVPKYLEGQTKGQVILTDESVGFKKKPKFDLLRSWGNLSPWFSILRGRFGVNSSPSTPKTCRITGLHFLHRHGARYPTAWGMLSSASPYHIVTDVRLVNS